MTSPEERREAQIRAIGQGGQFNELTEFGIEIFGNTLDRLLGYFDEHEPAVADAIRFGLRESRREIHGTGGFGDPRTLVRVEYVIDYAESHAEQ
jgi:hypothetical protein